MLASFFKQALREMCKVVDRFGYMPKNWFIVIV